MTTQRAPDVIDLIRELRREVGLFDGAMPITPKQAWEEAIERVRNMRALESHTEEQRRRRMDESWVVDL